MSISGGLITGYIVIGVISASFIFDNPPSWVSKTKVGEVVIQILFILFWLPYMILNAICNIIFSVDLWFRKKND